MVVVLGEIPIALIRVVKQVLVPAIRDALDNGRAHLESNNLIHDAVQSAAGAQRNGGYDFLLTLKRLDDAERGRFCIQDGEAMLAHCIYGLSKAAELD